MGATADQWNANVLRYRGSFLQSFEWGEMQTLFGRAVYRVAHDTLQGQLIAHALPFRLRYLYVPRGPVGEWTSSALAAWFHEVKKYPAIFLRLDPPQQTVPAPGFAVHDVGRSAQPRKNCIITVNKEDEGLLSSMHEKTRYNVRLAQKRGVVVRVGREDEEQKFFRLLEETALRQNIRLHPRAYYRAMLRSIPALGDNRFAQKLQRRLYIAEHEGSLLAAALIIYFGDRATYVHGGSSEEKKNMMAPYALHWQVIKDARDLGVQEYDLGGVDEARWPGLTRFKSGFGGSVEEFPDAIDVPLRRAEYALYRLVRYGK